MNRVKQGLSVKQNTHVFLQAKPGWTSRQLLKSVQTVQESIWAEGKLITLMIGGNDLLRASPWLLNGSHSHTLKVAERLYENMNEIVTTVKRPTNKLVVCTIYNPFPNSLIAEEYTELVNKLIRKLVYQRHLILADVQKGFLNKEEQLIDRFKRGKIRDFKLFGNPIHPNDEGHKVIAKTVLSAYRRQAVKPRPKRRRLE